MSIAGLRQIATAFIDTYLFELGFQWNWSVTFNDYLYFLYDLCYALYRGQYSAQVIRSPMDGFGKFALILLA